VRVLVVDDNPIVLASCRRILEEEGFTVVTVGSVNQAIEEAVAQGFGLIIVDIKMPEQDGHQLMKRVKAWRKPTPVIAMSGYPTSETVQSSLTSGAFVFLPKPFTPDELIAALRVVVPGELRERPDPQDRPLR
jgi:DNA-binding NtrC family response regulator